jgi:hypothetical protein
MREKRKRSISHKSSLEKEERNCVFLSLKFEKQFIMHRLHSKNIHKARTQQISSYFPLGCNTIFTIDFQVFLALEELT